MTKVLLGGGLKSLPPRQPDGKQMSGWICPGGCGTALWALASEVAHKCPYQRSQWRSFDRVVMPGAGD